MGSFKNLLGGSGSLWVVVRFFLVLVGHTGWFDSVSWWLWVDARFF